MCKDQTYISSQHKCNGFANCLNGRDESESICIFTQNQSAKTVARNYCHPRNCTCSPLFNQTEDGFCVSYILQPLWHNISLNDNSINCVKPSADNCLPCTPNTTEFFRRDLLCVYNRTWGFFDGYFYCGSDIEGIMFRCLILNFIPFF